MIELDEKRIEGEMYLNLVCEMLNVPVEMAVSKSRKREYVEARQTSSFLMRKYTKLSQQSVADILNYESHASVWRDETGIPTLVKTNIYFAKKIEPVFQEARRMFREQYRITQPDYDFFDFYSEAAFVEPINKAS